MRKLPLLLILLLFLVACGGNNGSEQEANTATATNVAEAPIPTPTIAVPATLPPPAISTDEGAAEGDNAAAPEVLAPELPISPWPADAFGYGIQVHGIAGQGDIRAVADAVDNQLVGPVTQPWKAAENLPASDPATAIWMFRSQANLGARASNCSSTIFSAAARGMPAPEISFATISLKGREVTC